MRPAAPVVAAAGGIAATVAVGAGAVLMLSAVLGGHDPRSPLVRLMLIVCAINGCWPGDDVLPTEPTAGNEASRGATRHPQSRKVTACRCNSRNTSQVNTSPCQCCRCCGRLSGQQRHEPGVAGLTLLVCAPFLTLTQRPFCPFPSFRRTGCVRWVALLGAWMRDAVWAAHRRVLAGVCGCCRGGAPQSWPTRSCSAPGAGHGRMRSRCWRLSSGERPPQ